MALYVRDLKTSEGQKIQHILRKSTRRMAMRRAQVILMSAQSYTVKEIALQTLMHPEYIRELIRRFNKEGVALFNERPRSGRPVEFTQRSPSRHHACGSGAAQTPRVALYQMVAGKTERTFDQNRDREIHQSGDTAGNSQRTKSPFAAHQNHRKNRTISSSK